jgi:hypothetical protein
LRNFIRIVYDALSILCLIFFLSCKGNQETSETEKTTKTNQYNSASPKSRNENRPSYTEENDEKNSEPEDEEQVNGCKYEDGTHSATVEYTNTQTGYSQTYTLDVEVENCEVVQINFPRGGWLDSDHISPEQIDSDGSCTIEGEEGKTYEVQIDD